MVRNFYDVDDLVHMAIEAGDYQGARRYVNDDEGVLSANDRQRLLNAIAEAEGKAKNA